MMKIFLSVVLAGMLMTQASCSPTTFSTGAPKGASHTTWASFFIFGLAGEATVDAAALCPNGVSTVQTYAGFGNVLVTLITFGLYAPRTVEVTCAAGAPPGAGAGAEGPMKVWIGHDEDGQPTYVAKRTASGEMKIQYAPKGAQR